MGGHAARSGQTAPGSGAEAPASRRGDSRNPSDELSAIFSGDLAVYRDALVFSASDRRGVPAVDLLRPDAFDRAVDPFVTRYPGADRRAAVSFWTQWYFGTLVPPYVAASLLLDLDLPLALDEVAVLLDEEERRPAGFRLPHDGRWLEPDADPFERFDTLVSEHLAPLVDAVAEHSGLAPRLLWSNAGSYFDWIVRELDGGEDGSGVASSGTRFLNSRTRPDGSKNPLFQPVRDVSDGEEEVLQRRICCLRYLLPGVEGCGGHCPLPE